MFYGLALRRRDHRPHSLSLRKILLPFPALSAPWARPCTGHRVPRPLRHGPALEELLGFEDTAADAGDPQDEKLMAAVGLRPGAVVTQAMAHLG